MKRREVRLGGTYAVRVGDHIVPVRLEREVASSMIAPPWGSPWRSGGGWYGRNLLTGREIRVRTAGRLRGEIPTESVEQYLSRPLVRA